jgi:hypothetical protein
MQRSRWPCGSPLVLSLLTALLLLPASADLRVDNHNHHHHRHHRHHHHRHHRQPARPASPAQANLQAKAPWGIAVPQPGQLVRHSVAGLKETHFSLTDVSQELMGIQSDVAITEQSLFGKIVDAKTARDLVDQQRLIEAGNARASEDVLHLRDNVGELSELLVTAKAMNSHWQAVVATLRAGLARNADEELEHHRLLEAENVLKVAETKEVQKAKGIMGQIDTLHQAAQAEVAKQKELRDAIAKASKMAKVCQGEEAKDEAELKGKDGPAPKDADAIATAEKLHQSTINATNQRLRAEVAILVSEVAKAEDSGKKAFQAVQNAKARLVSLEETLTWDVRDISEGIQKATSKLGDVKTGIAKNEGMFKAGSLKKGEMDKQIVKLHEEISPIETATTQAENDALQTELNQALMLLTRSKAAEAVSLATAMQEQAKVGAFKQAALLASRGVVMARQESQTEIERVVQLTAETKQQSELSVKKANGAIEDKCKNQWARHAGDITKEVNSCRAMKQDLDAARAQQSTLEHFKLRMRINDFFLNC